MTGERTNYVVTCWNGPRRAENKVNQQDRTSFIRAHMDALKEFSHSLNQITIVLAEGGDEKADAYIKSLKGKKVGKTPIQVLVRPNVGMSYAGWNLAHETFGDKFTHYIVVEDDYIPYMDDFDQFLVDFAEKYGTYVCGLSADGKVAAISNGVIPERVWRQVKFPSLAIRPADCQVAWSRAFGAAGFTIEEYLEHCSSPFWLTRAIRWYGHPGLPPLFVPVQAVGRNVSVTGGPEMAMVQFKGGEIVPSEREPWVRLLGTKPEDPCWRGRFPPPLREQPKQSA